MKKESPFNLAIKNVRKKYQRTLGLTLAQAMLAFVLFSGLILTSNLENGLKAVSARFGADIMVLPAGYDGEMENILLGSQPRYFYFDKSILSKIENCRGVDKIASQLYLISSSRGCCAGEVQFVGIDYDSDFVVKPWISKVYPHALKKGELILGSNVVFNETSSKIKFYGKLYTIVAVLDKSDSGMDNTIYTSMETIQDMYLAAKERGFRFKEELDIQRSISSVLIKVGKEYTKDEVKFFIERAVGRRSGIQVMAIENVVRKVEKQITHFVHYVRLLQSFVLFFSIITLSMLFSVTIRERKMEFATLRAIGATKSFTQAVVLSEAFIICLIASLVGIALASLILFPFTIVIGKSIGLPYVALPFIKIILLMVSVLFLTITVGVLSSLYSAIKTGKAELYLMMREGD